MRLPTGPDDSLTLSEHVVVFVEVPSGSRNEYELDEELGPSSSIVACSPRWRIRPTTGSSRARWAATATRSTRSSSSGAHVPGCRIRGRVVGVFHMADEKGPDEKILCVPLKDPAWMRVSDVHDIPAELRNEIEHFFQVYKDLEEEKVETRGYGNRAEAIAIIAASRQRAS